MPFINSEAVSFSWMFVSHLQPPQYVRFKMMANGELSETAVDERRSCEASGCRLGGVELNPPSRIAVHYCFQKYPIFSIIVRLFTTKIKDYEKEIGFYHCGAGNHACS